MRRAVFGSTTLLVLTAVSSSSTIARTGWAAPGVQLSGARITQPITQPVAALPPTSRGNGTSGAGGLRLRAVVPSEPPPRILPLSEVRPGMIGEALTVFRGRKPEPFKVRVVSVMHNFLPKQDVILIRAEDPRVEFSGIVAGMSGSPVYVDGKLMGAVAYGWSFSKEPLGGVTPIETMLAERARPLRAKDDFIIAGRKGGDGIRTVTVAEGGGGGASRMGVTRTPAAFERGLGLPSMLPVGGSNGEPRLQRAAVPLSVAGFSATAVAELGDALRPTGLVPMQAGGGRKLGPEVAGQVEPGSAIGVELVRGDMSTVGTGTVTYIDGSHVFAFGHPMFGIGEVYLPMVDAEIHAFLPSVAQSFKMSSPLNEVGTLVQDRQSCIIGDLDARTTMVPVTVQVSGPGAEPRVFRAEVARNRRLTPMLASLVTSSAIADAEPDVADMVVTVTSKVNLKGHAPLELRDQLFSAEGVSGKALASSRGLRALGDLLFNPFEPVALDRVDVDVRVEYRRDIAEIVGVSLPGDAVRAGDTVPLKVSLRPYAGAEYVETVPVVIPRTVGGDMVKIEVATGAAVKPDVPQAESLRVYLDNLRKFYTASSIVVSVQTPEDGAALRGRLLSGLPESALDTLQTGKQTRRADAYRVADRTVFPTSRLVSGRQELTVFVRDDVLGDRR